MVTVSVKAGVLGDMSHTGLRAVDRRTHAGRHLADMRERLTELVGGNPDIAEKEIIDRAAMLSLKIAQMDKKIMLNSDFSERDSEFYLAWTNTYCRILKMLPQREGADYDILVCKKEKAGRYDLEEGGAAVPRSANSGIYQAVIL